MTTSPDTDRGQAEADAVAWLVRLSEQPNDADLHGRFEAWRMASVLHAEAWAKASLAYDLAGKGTPRHPAHWQSYAATRTVERALPPAHPSPPAVYRHLFTPRRLTFGVACVAIAALFMIAILPGSLLRLYGDAVTGTGEVRSLTLEDGSRVSLAPESAIRVAFTGTERQVRLVKGEAFFEVVHNAARPFQVAVGDTVATDTGTAFDVRRDVDGALVAVQSGRVHIADESTVPATARDLRPGDWVHVVWHSGIEQGRVIPADIADWRSGQFVAHDQPAREVVAALRRYYGGLILVRDDPFAAKRVSGIYDLTDPVKTLRELATVHGATVWRISPWLILITPG